MKQFVCRCEDVTLHELMNGIERGHRDIESLKRYTGFGTGYCQGKWCLATLRAHLGGTRRRSRSGHHAAPALPPGFAGGAGRHRPGLGLSMDKLEKKLLSAMAKASSDFRLLEPGDRVMVAVSGGKDSHAMLYLLRELQRRAPFDFSLFALNVDQGHPGFPSDVLARSTSSAKATST